MEAEQFAVRDYTQICNMTAGKDHRTYDLSLAILITEMCMMYRVAFCGRAVNTGFCILQDRI